MKILFAYRAIHDTAGGVERIIAWLMNQCAEHGHQVEFITLDKKDACSFYPLNKEIIWHRLDSGDTTRNASFATRFKRIAAIRDLASKFQPDMGIGFQEASFLSLRLAVCGLGIPVIAAERNSPSRFKYMPKGKAALAFASFCFSRLVCIQAESFRSGYPDILKPRLRVIANPVFPVAAQSEERKNIILSVGRLSYQKNFSCLIKAFAEIALRFPDWKLNIIGAGEDRREIDSLIELHHLQNRVFIFAPRNDLSQAYAESKIFCLASRWEGFPNAMAEALAYGVPATGFAGCGGINDMVQDGRNGLLAKGCDDPANLADALARLMENGKSRDEMASRALQSVATFGPSVIYDEWERLFKEAVSK